MAEMSQICLRLFSHMADEALSICFVELYCGFKNVFMMQQYDIAIMEACSRLLSSLVFKIENRI